MRLRLILIVALALMPAVSALAVPLIPVRNAASAHIWVQRHPPALQESIGGFVFTKPSARSLAVDALDGSRLWAATVSNSPDSPPPGVYSSSNAGRTWIRPAGQPVEFNVASPIIAASPISAAVLLGGFEDGTRDGEGGLLRSADGGQSWSLRRADLRVTSIAWSVADAQVIYAAGFGVGGSLNGGPLRSDDGGLSWSPLPIPRVDGVDYAPKLMVVDPSDASHVWATGGGGLFESSDGGMQWTQRLPADRYINALAISPTTPTLMLLGDSSGLFRSEDGGQSWSAVDLPPVEYGTAVDLLAWSPALPNVVYAVRRSHQIWRSEDEGLSWRSDSGGLPPSLSRDPVALVFASDDDDRLYTSLAYDRVYAGIPVSSRVWLPLVQR